MKRLPLVVTAVLVLTLVVIGCAKTPQPQPFKSRYTADQVIAIAQAKYPACYKRVNLGEDTSGIFRHTDVQTPPSITVDYIGGSRAAWKVMIRCPDGYFLGIPFSGSYLSNKTLIAVYFYETDGSLRDTYYP